MSIGTGLRRVVGLGLLGLTPAAACLAATPYEAFPVSTVPGAERFPKTDGRYVVWTDVYELGEPAGTTNDAYAYDLVTRQRITLASGPGEQDEPSVSGGVAVWSESGNIMGRNLGTGGQPFTVTAAPGIQTAHEISGDLVVWQDGRTSPQQIWGRRLSQPDGSEFPITGPAAHEQIFADVSGNTVVWMSFQEGADQGNIYARDADGGNVVPVTTAAGYQYFPKISGRTVVWNDNRSGQVRVWARNLDSGAEFPVSSGVSPQYLASVDGDLVVWRDDRTGVSDIWGRFLSGGPEFQITDTPNIWEDYPEVGGNVVVWEQSTTGADTDIYATVVPEPAGAAVALAAAASLLARRRRRPA